MPKHYIINFHKFRGHHAKIWLLESEFYSYVISAYLAAFEHSKCTTKLEDFLITFLK